MEVYRAGKISFKFIDFGLEDKKVTILSAIPTDRFVFLLLSSSLRGRGAFGVYVVFHNMPV